MRHSATPSMWRWALTAALVATVLVGCGIPTESTAREIPADQTVSTLPTPTTTPTPTANTVTLYFVDGERLSQVVRRVKEEPNLDLALNRLLAGPTKEELNEKLVSSIPTDTKLLGTSMSNDGRTATVDLSDEFVSTADLYQPAAQIVYTVTANSSADRVTFTVDGKSQSLPTDEGNQKTLLKRDYGRLAPL